MTATASLDDLEWLLEFVQATLPTAVGPKPTKEQRDRASRVEDFIVTAIDTRRAQKAAKPTTHHEQLMEAYYAARDGWLARVEACGWPTERLDFIEANPRPTLKAFMIAHRQRHAQATQAFTCPECGAVIDPVQLRTDGVLAA